MYLSNSFLHTNFPSSNEILASLACITKYYQILKPNRLILENQI